MKNFVRILALCLVFATVATLFISCGGKSIKLSGTYVSEPNDDGSYEKYVFTTEKYTRYKVVDGISSQSLTGKYEISDGKIILKNGGGGPSETYSFSNGMETLTINGVLFTKK